MYEENYSLSPKQLALNAASIKMLSQTAQKRLSQNPELFNDLDVIDASAMSDEAWEYELSQQDNSYDDIREEILADFEINCRAKAFIESLHNKHSS